MLSAIRDKTQGIITAIILGLLAIPFALWGVNSYFETGSDLTVARVGGEEIKTSVYRRTLDQQRRLFESQAGRQVDPVLFETPMFKQQVLNSLVDELLIAQDTQARGYRVSDAELARIIREEPQFQRDGQFDPALYNLLLRNASLSAQGFEQRLRQDHIRQQVERGFQLGAIVLPSDVDAVVRLMEQKREIRYVTIRPDRFLPEIKLDAAKVEEYYNNHLDEFRTPERIRVDYLRLAVADLAEHIEISEDELRKLYAEQVAQQKVAEERRASHILLAVPSDATPEQVEAVKKQANELRAKLAAGANFAELAKKHSEDPGSAAKGGDLGFAGRGAYVPEFESALYALKKNELSEPVRTQFGFHLIKLTDVKTPPVPSFEQRRAELQQQLRTRRAEEQFYDLSERFRNLVYEQSDSLKPAAEALGLNVQQSDWFTRQGGTGIAAQSKVVQAAFDPEVLSEGRNSQTIELSPTEFVAVRLAAREEPKQRPFEAVRAEIEGRLKRQQAQEQASQAAEAIVGKLRAGDEDFAVVAKQHGIAAVESKSVTRRAAQGADPRLIEAVFGEPRPSDNKPIYGTVQLGSEGMAVYALKQVVDGDPSQADPALKNQVRQILVQHRGRGYFQDYIKSLRENTKVRTYEDRL